MSGVAAARPRQEDIAFQANLYDDPNPTRRGLHQYRRAWVETAIASHLQPGDRLLEVGIGCGVFTRFVARLGAKTTAVDINPLFVDGVASLPNVHAVVADATRELELGVHRIALCTEVLEHVEPRNSLAMLKAIHGALEPGGLLILTTPQRFATVELMARLLKIRPVLAVARALYGNAEELGHLNLMTAGALQKQIVAAGFAIEHQARFGFYLPVIAEFGGASGARLLTGMGRLLRDLPVLKGLIWTQAYVLKKR